MNAEDGIRRLLTEPNAPNDCVEQALECVLAQLAFSTEAADDSLWKVLRAPQMDRFRHVGPRPHFHEKVVRVARVLTLRNFVEFYAGPTYYYSLAAEDMSEVEQAINAGFLPVSDFVGLVASRPTAWVTLDQELDGRSANEILNGLGRVGFGLGDEPMVAISYRVPTDVLRVPTCFDAAFDPAFVSKPPESAGVSRAWNWTGSQWGLSELIHGATKPDQLADAIVRILGTPHEQNAGPEFLAAFTIPASRELEHLVGQILRQVAAHRDLGGFLAGERDTNDLTPREFEGFVATLYRRFGYHATVTKATHDGGFDIVAVRNPERGESILIQAKKTCGTVGISVIRELIGARFLAEADSRSSVLVVVTTGRFSRQAMEARQLHASELQLIDYMALQKQLHTYAEVGVKDIVRTAMEHRDEAFARNRLSTLTRHNANEV